MLSEKKTRGRQKIEMKKISNESNLQVTFSKRRSGLFKNASELCTLCGANVALILFSPSDKVFSFDHPNVMTVIDRYLSRGPHQNDGTMQFNETRRNTIVQNLNDLLSEMNNRIDIEKRSCDEMSHVHNMNEAQYCGGCLIDRMNMVQLELRENALKELKILVDQQAHRLAIQEPQTLPFFAANGSSSNMLLQPNPQQAKMFMEQSFPINHNPPTQTLPFFTASGSSSNMSLDHQSNPQLAQMFLKQSFPVIQNPVTQTLPFFDGNGSSSNMPPNHQPNSQQAQMFMEQSFENHMLKSNLFGFNNIGGQGGGGGEDPSHFD